METAGENENKIISDLFTEIGLVFNKEIFDKLFPFYLKFFFFFAFQTNFI